MKNEKFERKNLPADFTITFHTGFLGTPENSVAGIAAAAEMNAPVAEMDITFREDGTPVIIHADSAGKDGGESFDDALAEVAKNPAMRINLDIKSIDNIPAIDDLVKKHGLESRAFYTGVSEEWTETVRKGSTLPYYLNHSISAVESKSKDKLNEIADTIRRTGACGLNTNYTFVNKKVVDLMHSCGYPVSVWTVNRKDTMKKFLRLGADNITTLRPDKLKELISE